MDKIILTWEDTEQLAAEACGEIKSIFKSPNRPPRIHPVPNGGIHAVRELRQFCPKPYIPNLTVYPDGADMFFDDIIDSGKTKERFAEHFPGKPFLALVDKTKAPWKGKWVVFPWEAHRKETAGPQDAIIRLLTFIGEDPNRDGLKDTPTRVLKSYSELFSGYKADNIQSLFKKFDGCKYDEVILVRNIMFTSMCEHHMLPFSGEAAVAYIPNGPIIGISKMARLVEVFARRLQVQERMTMQIADTLDEHLKPLGSACIIQAQHSCMSCRGVKKEATTITSRLTGVFRNKPEARQELMTLLTQGL